FFGEKRAQTATVIANAIDANQYRLDARIRSITRQALGIENRYVVGFVGRFTALKNIPYVLKVFKVLLTKRENAVLLMVGDGEMRAQIAQEVENLKIAKAVQFLGTRADVSRLLMAMDVLLFPSFSEGFGLVMLEAQAAALKCIASLGRVSTETCISAYSHYEAIEKPPGVWADMILNNCLNYERIDMVKEVGKHHFDVRIEAQKLIDFYNRA